MSELYSHPIYKTFLFHLEFLFTPKLSLLAVDKQRQKERNKKLFENKGYLVLLFRNKDNCGLIQQKHFQEHKKFTW